MVRLSIIIVNWHSKVYLKECLSSVARETQGRHCEVIVVDNASFDGAGEMVAAEFPSVVFIQNNVNRGFSAANNAGFARAAGTYILMLNPDTIVRGGAILQMTEFLQTHPEYGAVGCKVLSENGVIDFHGGRQMPTLWRDSFIFRSLRRMFGNSGLFSSSLLEHWDHASSRDVALLSGSCMMFRRAVLERIGGMDEGFFMYGEDMDFCYRIMQSGWKLHYLGEAEIIHLGSRSTSMAGLALKVEGARSMKRFFEKHRGRIYAMAYLALLGFSSMLHLTFDALLFWLGGAKHADRKEKITMRTLILQWLLQGAR